MDDYGVGSIVRKCIVTKTPPMWCVLAMICAFGYLLEILNPRTIIQAYVFGRMAYAG